MKSNNNIKIVILILGIIFSALFIAIYNFGNYPVYIVQNNVNSEVSTDINIKNAEFWPDESPIYINDTDTFYNWSYTEANYDWCNLINGFYVIENVTIKNQAGNAIDIYDSDVPFIIRNCTIENNGYTGIALYNVNNSRLIDNKIINNGDEGIWLENGNNNTIVGNTITDHYFEGIWVTIDAWDETVYCYNNNISGNTLINNGWGGIYFEIYGEGSSQVFCCNNTISGNIIYDNEDTGIGLDGYAEDDTDIYIFNNSISGNIINKTRQYYDGGDWYAGDGLFLGGFGRDSAEVEIYNNTISSNSLINNEGYGIYLESTELPGSEVEIEDNYIIGNTLIENKEIGIHLDGVTDTTLSSNEMYGNGIGITGGNKEEFDSHDIGTSNKANNNPIYYYTDQNYLETTSGYPDAGQVILVNCNHSQISELDVSNASVGIALAYSDNVTISKNNASYGVFGIALHQCNMNNISANRANNNKYPGILLISCNNNNITQNTANNNEWGVYLWSSNNTLVSGNTLLGNTNCYYQTPDCVGNLFINNNCGAAPPGAGDDDDDDDDEERGIPGYDLFIILNSIFIFLGVICVILVKKRLKFQ